MKTHENVPDNNVGRKTTEEIKNGLECCEKYLNGVPEEECCHVCDYQNNCAELKLDALALIQQLEAQVPKWISVEERLPKPYKNVIVYRKYLNPVSGYCVIDYIELTGQGGFEWSKSCASWKYVVTHWMPLPEPPKEEERKAAEWEK